MCLHIFIYSEHLAGICEAYRPRRKFRQLIHSTTSVKPRPGYELPKFASGAQNADNQT